MRAMWVHTAVISRNEMVTIRRSIIGIMLISESSVLRRPPPPPPTSTPPISSYSASLVLGGLSPSTTIRRKGSPSVRHLLAVLSPGFDEARPSGLDLVGHAVGGQGLPDAVAKSVFALGAERSEGTGSIVDGLANAVPGVHIRRTDDRDHPPALGLPCILAPRGAVHTAHEWSVEPLPHAAGHARAPRLREDGCNGPLAGTLRAGRMRAP